MSTIIQQALAGAAVLGLALATAPAGGADRVQLIADLPFDDQYQGYNGNGNGNGYPPDVAENGYPSHQPYLGHDQYRKPPPFNGGNRYDQPYAGGNGNGNGNGDEDNGYDDRSPYADNHRRDHASPDAGDDGGNGYGNSHLPPAGYDAAPRNGGEGYDWRQSQPEGRPPQYDWRRPQGDPGQQQYGFGYRQSPAQAPYGNGDNSAGPGRPTKVCERVVTSSRWDYSNDQWVPVYRPKCRWVQAY